MIKTKRGELLALDGYEVRELQWKASRHWDEGKECYETVYGTGLREYQIISYYPDETWAEGREWFKLYMADDFGPYPSLEQAKKAAQDHYKATVLSALTKHP